MPDLVLSTPGSYKFWPIFNSDLTPSNILQSKVPGLPGEFRERRPQKPLSPDARAMHFMLAFSDNWQQKQGTL